MKLFSAIGVASTIILLFTASCSHIQTYSNYSSGIFNGKAALRRGQYEEAKRYFNEASVQIKDRESLAYLGTAEYKLGNLDSAEKIFREAEKMDGKYYSHYHLRIFGYKALTLLKKNDGEGCAVLKEYIDLYACVYPLPTLYDVEQMWAKKAIQFNQLEKLIEEQVLTYENDVDQYLSARIGFYQRNLGGWDF